jgi:hypothetical protein
MAGCRLILSVAIIVGIVPTDAAVAVSRILTMAGYFPALIVVLSVYTQTADISMTK